MIRKGVRHMAALRWRTAGLLLAVLVIVALPYMVTRGGAEQSLLAGERVTHSAEVKSLVYRISYLVRDSETAIFRLLAKEPNPKIESFARRANDSVPALLQQLHETTRNDPDQEQLVGELASTVNGRLTLMQQALTRYHAGDNAGAYAAMRDAGELFKIDGLISSFIAYQDRILQDRRIAATQQSFNSSAVLAITAIAQILMLMTVVIVSERQIGQRLRAEVRESAAVQRSRMIVQAVREPIALLDEKLHPLLVNAAFGELYGLDGQGSDLPLQQLGNGAWSDTVLLQRLTDVLSRDRELWDHELIQRTVDGVDRHVLINARRLQETGDDPSLLLTVSDVTARALVEQQVKELNQQLEGKIAQVSDVNRELEAFSYSVSHDLRAPLRHIAGFALKLEARLGDKADEQAQHYMTVIREAAKRMGQLIDELLVFSRLGRGALRLQTVDLQSVVDEARVIAEADAEGRKIVWRISPLPIVIGDENMLRTVWQNLLGNAVKYTGQRETAHIDVSMRRDANGDYEFTVSDDGAGFDMQYADKLFGVFQRLHKASEFPGNGIGLANVRRIILRHGGRIWAEAEPGKGAHFHFTLSSAELPAIISRDKT